MHDKLADGALGAGLSVLGLRSDDLNCANSRAKRHSRQQALRLGGVAEADSLADRLGVLQAASA